MVMLIKIATTVQSGSQEVKGVGSGVKKVGRNSETNSNKGSPLQFLGLAAPW